MQQVRRALVAAFVLGGFASLLQLALPLYALHVFESAIPTASLETLALLTLIAAAAAAALVSLAAARDRILLRAGLWLDHTLGPAHARERRAARHPAGRDQEGRRRARPPLGCACRPGRRCRARCAMAADLSWRRSCSCIRSWGRWPLVCALLLVAGDIASRLAPLRAWRSRRRRPGESTATGGWRRPWRRQARLPAGAADQWERLDRAHVAAAYALGKRRALLQDLARLVRAGAQIALDLGRRLAGHRHELSLAALFACVLLAALLLESAGSASSDRCRVVAPGDGGLSAAARAARRCAQRSGCARAPALRSPPAPRLNVRGPLAVGLAAILLFIVAGLGRDLRPARRPRGADRRRHLRDQRAALQYPKAGRRARARARQAST